MVLWHFSVYFFKKLRQQVICSMHNLLLFPVLVLMVAVVVVVTLPLHMPPWLASANADSSYHSVELVLLSLSEKSPWFFLDDLEDIDLLRPFSPFVVPMHLVPWHSGSFSWQISWYHSLECYGSSRDHYSTYSMSRIFFYFLIK